MNNPGWCTCVGGIGGPSTPSCPMHGSQMAEDLLAEVVRLRADNERLRGEVARLKRPPPPTAGPPVPCDLARNTYTPDREKGLHADRIPWGPDHPSYDEMGQ